MLDVLKHDYSETMAVARNERGTIKRKRSIRWRDECRDALGPLIKGGRVSGDDASDAQWLGDIVTAIQNRLARCVAVPGDPSILTVL